MEIKTDIQEQGEGGGRKTAYREQFASATPVQLPVRKQFLLFGTVMDVSMIDKELKDKEISFEMSIGKSFGEI